MTVWDQIRPFKNNTAIALGVFDGVHIGHQAVIGEAVNGVEQGLTPVVFTFDMGDQKPFNKRGQEMILTERLKQQKFAQLGVDTVLCVRFDDVKDESPEYFAKEILLKTLRAKRIVCGFDFRFGKNASGTPELLRQICEAESIELVVVPPMMEEGEPVSSTRIRRYLKAGDIDSANRLLGYDYTVESKVIDGLKNGRKLGFPTINQAFAPDQLVPRYGVYASRVEIDGMEYGGVTNIGVKPTVAGERSPLAETFIIGYDQDLYGRSIPVSLFAFLREEQKFESFEALTKMIDQNIQTVKEILKIK